MTRRQADYELHAYAVFVGVLFAMVSGGALLSQDPQINRMRSPSTASQWSAPRSSWGPPRPCNAAWYCAAAPLVALLYFFVYGFHPNLNAIDHAALIGFGLIWLRYSLRVVGDRARLSGHARGGRRGIAGAAPPRARLEQGAAAPIERVRLS